MTFNKSRIRGKLFFFHELKSLCCVRTFLRSQFLPVQVCLQVKAWCFSFSRWRQIQHQHWRHSRFVLVAIWITPHTWDWLKHLALGNCAHLVTGLFEHRPGLSDVQMRLHEAFNPLGPLCWKLVHPSQLHSLRTLRSSAAALVVLQPCKRLMTPASVHFCCYYYDHPR